MIEAVVARALFAAVVVLGGCLSVCFGQCQKAAPDATARLTDYVHKKFNRGAADIVIVGDEAVGNSCFRKVRFRSSDPGSAFNIELFASPDYRFLARELMDSLVDPAEEDRQKNAAILAKLIDERNLSRGPKSAPVTLAVFSDFQCPFCAQLAQSLSSGVMAGVGERSRVVFYHVPSPFHPWARAAAEATICAEAQGDEYFWRAHDFVFQNQRGMAADTVQKRVTEELASVPGFDVNVFRSCLQENRAKPVLDRDADLARELGITGTPTVFVNSQRVTGYRPTEILRLVEQPR
jgi:protein-disulfide isomerase